MQSRIILSNARIRTQEISIELEEIVRKLAESGFTDELIEAYSIVAIKTINRMSSGIAAKLLDTLEEESYGT